MLRTQTPTATAEIPTVEKGTSLWRDAWRRLGKNRAAMFSFWLLATIVLLCFIGPLFAQSPTVIDMKNRSADPSMAHLFGTDQLGRDLLSRVLYGGRISLLVGLVATSVAVTIGVIYGAIAGYAGGRLDDLMMRLVDMLFALPFLVLVMLFSMVVSEPAAVLTEWVIENTGWARDAVAPITTLVPLFIAIGFIGWLTIARIVRSQVMSIKKQEFVEAAVSLGLGRTRILFRHIVPNIIGPVIVYTTLAVPGVMLLEAALSFLGLGVKPPNSSWGSLMKEGADRMEVNVWLLLFPSLFFSATLLALNFLGDGLRDALDPKASKD
jgi:oligopeptide transport system permease protein